MTVQLDSVISEITEQLGDRPFYSISELVRLGIFGSINSARAAILDGTLPSIKVSERRFIVPRDSVVNFLKSNFASKRG